MKRFRSGEELELESLNLAQVLMSISRNRHDNNNMFKIFEQPTQLHLSTNNNNFKIFEHPSTRIFEHPNTRALNLTDRRFECKTCNRQFPSFQALGGHRASHKKPRIMTQHCVQVSPTKQKIHECPICGLEFSIGQALGGHMRRHRAIGDEFEKIIEEKKIKKDKEEEGEKLCLDLNLAPPGTDWRKIGLNAQRVHKVSSMVDCFL